jgi:hypothetical protein
VARVKNRELVAIQERQQREARELQQLRSRYIAREESELAYEDKSRLRDIRSELERFVSFWARITHQAFSGFVMPWRGKRGTNKRKFVAHSL